jgi:hypothetical protein
LTFAVISLSFTPGLSHSCSIFQNDVSPIAEEIFRHSISSGVLIVRAPDIAGQALTISRSSFWNAAYALGS